MLALAVVGSLAVYFGFLQNQAAPEGAPEAVQVTNSESAEKASDSVASNLGDVKKELASIRDSLPG